MSVRYHVPPPSASASAQAASALGAVALAVQCPVCDHSNPAGARFCNECGSPVGLRGCPQCDAINERESAFCYKCGAPMGDPTSARRAAEPIGTPTSAGGSPKCADPGSLQVASYSAVQESAGNPDRVTTRPPNVPERAVRGVPGSLVLAVPQAQVRTMTRSPAFGVGLLLLLFATTVIAVVAHYRSGIVDRAIDAARSVWPIAESAGPGLAAPPTSRASEHVMPSEASTGAVVATSAVQAKSEPVNAQREAPGTRGRVSVEPATRPITSTPGNAPDGQATTARSVSGRATPGATSTDARASVAAADIRPATGSVVPPARRLASAAAPAAADTLSLSAAPAASCTDAVAAIGLCTPSVVSSGDR